MLLATLTESCCPCRQTGLTTRMSKENEKEIGRDGPEKFVRFWVPLIDWFKKTSSDFNTEKSLICLGVLICETLLVARPNAHWSETRHGSHSACMNNYKSAEERDCHQMVVPSSPTIPKNPTKYNLNDHDYSTSTKCLHVQVEIQIWMLSSFRKTRW